MINFVVCEDNNIVLQKNVDIINNTMFKNNIDYKIYTFTDYSDDFRKLILENMKNKIYILDIELNNISGIDIARNIRDTDMNSLIIISTTHIEYLPYTLKSKLMIFDYVSKFDDYENNLTKVIEKAVSFYFSNKYVSFKSGNNYIKVYITDICYIRYNYSKGYTIIKTMDNYYKTTKSFKQLVENLDNRFLKKNNFYYVNKYNKKNFSHKSKKERSVNK